MLRDLGATLAARSNLAGVLEQVRRGRSLEIEGLAGSYRAAVLAAIQVAVGRPLAVVTPGNIDLELEVVDLRTMLEAFGGNHNVVAFPPLGINPYGPVPPHDDIVRERLQTLDRCLRDKVSILISPVACWLERLQTPEDFKGRSLRLEVSLQLAPQELLAHLMNAGYRRVSLVESLGEIAIRGGIIDVFPPTCEHPVRVEFFGDEIESLREFNPRDQRSMCAVEAVEVPPATSRGAPEMADFAIDAVSRRPHLLPPEGSATLSSYLADPLWVELEPDGLRLDASEALGALDEHYHEALASGVDAYLPEELVVSLEEALGRPGVPCVLITELAGMRTARPPWRLLSQAAPSYRGRLADLARDLGRSLEAGDRVLFVVDKRGKAQRLAEILEGYDVPVTLDLNIGDEDATDATDAASMDIREFVGGTCWIMCSELSAGFRIPEQGVWVGTDNEVFGRVRVPGRTRRFHGEAFQGDFRDLTPGDFVIHEEHGVGRFVGVKTLEVAEATREFMEVEYRGKDRLYLPLEQLHQVQKYCAGETTIPRMDRLGGTSWSKVKSGVKRSLRTMAKGLLDLYAARKAIVGYSFGKDTPWQSEMEAGFEYEETPDQLSAIAEAKKDMESERPMDRLLCGDVGYGKTEVAVRAAFKAVLDGKQVAILAPTTVLAHQHWRTFNDRLSAFPVCIELLSRFRSAPEQKAIACSIREGKCDIVISTHRLFSRDIAFNDLGLLVLDEEQRFGVRQKEQLKLLTRQVDVLSMTATPIPRTLQMSLFGVRDLSLIETPPKDRYSIATHIVSYDPDIIANAIREELTRGGQVFFVHNRIRSIYTMAEALRELVPEGRYRVAHGQLSKVELERVMLDFVEGQADVLVTTAIIENGLDIPLANTILVHRADRFGLAQLYQLRGRVGRSDRRAYAYMIVPPLDSLSPIAKKRLRAIQEFSELGSGFRLAAMDMEIRGAGSLLGERQHGHIAAVGFEMYARLLEESVNELRGDPAPRTERAQLNIGMELQIPRDYIEDPIQRLMISKRLASAASEALLERLQEELRDRYGPLPAVMERLFSYARLRLLAESVGVQSVDRRTGVVHIRFVADPPIDQGRLLSSVQEFDGWSMEPPDRLCIETGVAPPEELIAEVRGALEQLI